MITAFANETTKSLLRGLSKAKAKSPEKERMCKTSKPPLVASALRREVIDRNAGESAVRRANS